MKLEAYSFSTVQAILQFLNMLEEEGTTDLRFTRQKVHDYVHAFALEHNRQSRRNRQPEIKCGKCGSLARKLLVNTNDKTVVEGDFKQVILCANMDCMHEEWS